MGQETEVAQHLFKLGPHVLRETEVAQHLSKLGHLRLLGDQRRERVAEVAQHLSSWDGSAAISRSAEAAQHLPKQFRGSPTPFKVGTGGTTSRGSPTPFKLGPGHDPTGVAQSLKNWDGRVPMGVPKAARGP